jgi:hypothetical protein
MREQQRQIDEQKKLIEELTEPSGRQQLIIESVANSICTQNSKGRGRQVRPHRGCAGKRRERTAGPDRIAKETDRRTEGTKP